MSTPKEIGKKFRDEREKQGLSVEAVAAQSRIHSRVIEDIENGVFDRIGGLYIKSFIKKYSSFLEMNTEEVLGLYADIVVSPRRHETAKRVNTGAGKKEVFSRDASGRKHVTLAEKSRSGKPEKTAMGGFTEKKAPSRDETGKKRREEFAVSLKKWTSAVSNPKNFQIALVALLSVVFIILIGVLVNMLKVRVENTVGRIKVAVADKPSSVAAVKKTIFPAAKKDGYTLAFMAEDDVWLQIKKDEEKVFAGTINKGKTVSWKLDAPVRVWTGKAEYLQCTYNGKKIGKIANGVVKDIIISGQGIKIGDSWIVQND